jgi:hypothetical protein
MRREAFLELLPVPLSDDEVHERAKEAAGVVTRIQAKKLELETHKEEAKTRTKKLETEEDAITARAYELALAVKSRREPRQVECREVYRDHTIYTVRQDTLEEVSSRAATKAEIEDCQQVSMFPAKKGKLTAVDDKAPDKSKN